MSQTYCYVKKRFCGDELYDSCAPQVAPLCDEGVAALPETKKWCGICRHNIKADGSCANPDCDSHRKGRRW